MAIGKGISTENLGENSFKQYIGTAVSKVLAVNPTKEELSKIYSKDITEDPVYTGTMDINGTAVNYAKVVFVLCTDEEKTNGIKNISRLQFFVRDEFRYNKDKTKVQIIDKYGRTSWATVDEAKAKKVPVDKNGNPLQIDADYREAYVGEDVLTSFIKAYDGIGRVVEWNAAQGKYIQKSGDLSIYECRLDNIKNLFNKDFKEIKDFTINIYPNGRVWTCYGIKTTDDGKMYTDIYTNYDEGNKWFGRVLNAETLQKCIDVDKALGRYKNTEFDTKPLHEYLADSVDTETSVENPFDTAQTSAAPW